jgi:sodium/proline symporter
VSAATAILITLIVYKVVLLGIGWWASRLTRDGTDFYLGGRRLGPWVAALSSSASASSAWVMLGLSGVAFAKGLSFVWLVPACLGGFIMNWGLIARRLRVESAAMEAVTVTDFLAVGSNPRMRRAIRVSASVIILASLGIYVASQFQGAGKTFHDTLGLAPTTAVMVGAGIVFLYTVTGGFWAVSISDVIQGLMMATAAIVVPIAAIGKIGGLGALVDGLSAQPAAYLALTAGKTGLDAVLFVGGLLAIGLGAMGQPHVINRFMALRSEKDVRLGAIVSISWAAVVLTGMFTAGLCGRLLVDGLGDGEVILVRLTTDLFPPVMAGIFVAAILSAIMSTADSQLLVCGATIAHDLTTERRDSILRDRLAVLAITIIAVVAALTLAKSVFDSALFAWSALGAAFGPLILVRLWRGPVAAPYALAAIWGGFAATLAWYFIPGLKGITSEILPGVTVAFVLVWLGANAAAKTAGVAPPRT